MARIAGITADRTTSGSTTFVRLDVRKHGENKHLQNFFKDVGFEVEKKAPSKCPRGYLTHDEFWKEADKIVDNLCKEYGILQ